MAISVVMPALEMAQETGKLISWLKKEGDQVSKGEMLLEIETDKAVMEIEAPADGVLAGIRAQAGAEIPVGQTIAWIVNPGEAPPAEAAGASASGRRTDRATSTEPSTQKAEAAGRTSGSDVRVSPKARRLAKERGIDLATIRGSGPGREILASDIPLVMNSGVSEAGASDFATPTSLSSVAKLMAQRTTQSWITVPHFFVTREMDATNLNMVREKLLALIERSHGVRLSPTDLLISVVARTLAKHQQLNASWIENGIRSNSEIHVAFAIAVDDGVVTAVVRNADKTNLGDIAVQRRDLAERARTGKLRPADITDGTFTISNLGMFNVDSFTAIITPPQAAILAVGRIADRVVAYHGQPTIRPMFTLTLSSDHRVVDGARAAQFMNDLARMLESLTEELVN